MFDYNRGYMNKFRVTLLISTYNWPEALSLSIRSALSQTVLPDEIVVADDGSTEKTLEVIEQLRSESSIPIRHVWHTDEGFRKTIILNNAIRETDGDYIIQIDGDIILHPKFIEDHLSEARKNIFLRGGRAILSPEQTERTIVSSEIDTHILSKELKNRLNSVRNPFLSLFLTRMSADIAHVKGCNISYWKNDFVKVNGYNNMLLGWGHEDIELAARFYLSGVKMKKIKMKGIAFHLYHNINSREQELRNYDVYQKVLEKKITYCEDGYAQGEQYPYKVL